MERGVQEPAAVDALIDIANRDSSAEFEAKLLAGRIQTRDVADKLLTAIRGLTVGEPTEEHRLTLSLPDGIRVHILEPANIHKVCVTQSFKGLPVQVERKIRYFESAAGRDVIDAPEVLARFTLRSEKPIKKDYSGDPNDPKGHIRIIHRKSFLVDGGEFRIDFSMVKSKTGKQTVRETLKNIPSHELEIEYIPRATPRPAAEVRASLFNIMNTLLGAYQESPAILLQSELQKYTQEFKFTGTTFYEIVSLDRSHVVKERPHNILKGYTVTNKADGIRAGLYVARDRRLLMVSRRGEQVAWTGMIAADDRHVNDCLDGEYIEELRLFCVFDVFRYKNKDVKGLPLFTTDEEIRSNPSTSRLGCAREFVQTMGTDFRTVVPGFKVETKLFLAGDGPAMEEAIQQILDTEFPYKTDGLVFTPRASPVMPKADSRGRTWLRVYKWKPPHQNSIDFLMKFDKETAEYDSATERMARKGSLYVSRSPGEDIIYPCETLTGEYVPPQLPEDLRRLAELQDRVPSVFQPSAPRDPDAYQIWVPVNRKGVAYDIEENRVEDNTIVECSFDMDTGRWNVMRTRYDKTYEYRVLRKPQYGNDIKVADNIWKLIHFPVTESMLRNVVSNPPDDTFEDDAYYRDEDSRESVTKNLRGFHNRVKESQYLSYVMPKNTLLEFAVGRAGDLLKWRKAKASKVFGIDTSPESFSLPRGGACVRYLNEKRRNPSGLPKVLFAEGDMTKPFEEQSGRYLNMVFGDESATTPYLQEFAKITEWDVAACQFAIHYACSSEETFKIFIENVRKHCKSVFFGTCLDGKAVYTLLAGKDRYILRSGGRTFAQIDKRYTDDGEWTDSFGQQIDVTLESTEKPMAEYLVPFDRVVELFNEAGFDLLDSKPFSELYISQNGISLDESQQEYSFLHRTFAFKKRAEAPKVVEEVKIVVEEKPEGEEEEEEEEKAPVANAVLGGPANAVQGGPVAEAPSIVFFFSKEPENKEFTNFYDARFKMEDVEFKNAEQAFQAYKASTFGDNEIYQKILKSKSGQSAKAFGKKVTGFDESVWDEKKDKIMSDILRAKFTQNPPLYKKLLETGNAILAEANPRDSYWGIGTSAGTSVAKDPSKWKGKNRLGNLLMELRAELQAEEDAAEAAIRLEGVDE